MHVLMRMYVHAREVGVWHVEGCVRIHGDVKLNVIAI